MWWRALSVLGIANVCLWLAIWQFSPISDPYHSAQLALSGVYVLVCAYRSVFPRVDLERLVPPLDELVLQVHAVDDPRRGLFSPAQAES